MGEERLEYFTADLMNTVQQHYPPDHKLTTEDVDTILDSFTLAIGSMLLNYTKRGEAGNLGKSQEGFIRDVLILFHAAESMRKG